jgi:hypothetical protein
MIARLREEFGRKHGQLATSAAQLLLLGLAAQIGSRGGWLSCLSLMALLSLIAWAVTLRRHRAIADIPTARIASAAQGYVELRGHGRRIDGIPVVSHLTGLPCLWYRYRVEERDGEQRWRIVGEGESEASVLLDDGSGVCLVDLDGAEILTHHKESWTRDGFRHTEWKLLIGDPLYALGHFTTLGGSHLELDARHDVGALLAEWKRDPARLRERFDLDGDGRIDPREWTLARRAAQREVAKEHRAAREAADTHVLRRPPDGRLFLLANLDPERIARRYRRWSIFHLAVFFAALAALAQLR